MIGSWIIENVEHRTEAGQDVRRIWCMDREGNERAIYAEPAAACLREAEQIWWQGGRIMARNDTVQFDKIGYSFDPIHAGDDW